MAYHTILHLNIIYFIDCVILMYPEIHENKSKHTVVPQTQEIYCFGLYCQDLNIKSSFVCRS